MNYRHIYHAGNFADVFKHLLLCRAINYLNQKDKPYFVLDTHGGIGRYDLTSEAAQKTDEFRSGVQRLLDDSQAPSFTDDYRACIEQLNEQETLVSYPGSPWLSQSLMRPQDRLVVCELHQQDSQTLIDNLRPVSANKKLEVLAPQNGYQALKGKLPPTEKRGLVLIDPPFEQLDEFDQVVRAVSEGLKRWQNGSYAIWYPIKDPVKIAAFHQHIASIPSIPKTVAIELMIRSTEADVGLAGCGFVWINPPYGLMQELPELLDYLTPLLALDNSAESHYRWLVEE